LLTGTGNRAFCAGRDTKVSAGEDPVQLDMQRRKELWTYTDALLTFDKPLVVAANASAIGAGFMLCLHADQVLSVPNAVFSLPEINIGISSWLGHCLVAEIAGNALANDMSITGRKVDANEALSKGLIHTIVPALTLHTEAVARARSLIEKPRPTFRDIKQWILKRRQQSVEIARQRHQLNNQA
jgi:enoyl-CoA hydratase/carnithine racemase